MKSFENVFETIVTLTPLEPKTVFGVMNHLMQEVGELAEAVAVHEGVSNKTLSEPLSGEVADVVNCALAVLIRLSPSKSKSELLAEFLQQFELKTAKWASTVLPEVVAPKTMADALRETGVVPALTKELKIEQRISQNLAIQLGFPESKIFQPDQNIVSDLGADSLDLVELVMAMEDEFNLEISDEEAEQVNTVQELYEYIKFRVGMAAQPVWLRPDRLPATPNILPESGKVYAQIRKHPNPAVTQPTGKRRVYRMDKSADGKTLIVGIGENGAEGWRFNLEASDPSFITFRLGSDTGPTASLKEAFEYWQKHNP